MKKVLQVTGMGVLGLALLTIGAESYGNAHNERSSQFDEKNHSVKLWEAIKLKYGINSQFPLPTYQEIPEVFKFIAKRILSDPASIGSYDLDISTKKMAAGFTWDVGATAVFRTSKDYSKAVSQEEFIQIVDSESKYERLKIFHYIAVGDKVPDFLRKYVYTLTIQQNENNPDYYDENGKILFDKLPVELGIASSLYMGNLKPNMQPRGEFDENFIDTIRYDVEIRIKLVSTGSEVDVINIMDMSQEDRARLESIINKLN